MRGETRQLRAGLTDAEARERREALAAAEVLANLCRWRIKVSRKLAEPLLDSIAAMAPGAVRAEKEARYAQERLKQRELGAQLKAAKDAAADLVEGLARGWEMREVWVELTREGSHIVAVRTDTGEEIERRPATKEELEPGEES